MIFFQDAEPMVQMTQQEWLAIGVSILIVFIVALIGRWIINALLERFVRRMVGQTETQVDDIVLEAVTPPIYWLVVVIASQVAINRLDFVPSGLEQPLSLIFFILYLLTIVVFVWRVVTSLFDWYARQLAATREIELSERLLPFFRRMFLILVVLIAVIALLGRLDVQLTSLTGLITTLGIGSLAIALAAQASLEDVITGILIVIDSPYRIGDRIEIIDLGTVGDVQDIGLRSTRVLTVENRMVIVPNSLIGKSMVVNLSFPDNEYRIQTQIGIAYGSDIEKAREAMVRAVKGVDVIQQYRPVEALLVEFGDSSLNFVVRFWVRVPINTRYVADRVNTAIYNELMAEGIEIPFPQRDLNLGPAATQLVQQMTASDTRKRDTDDTL